LQRSYQALALNITKISRNFFSRP